LVAGAGEPFSTLALVDQIDASNAPRPVNDGERLLFRQLYETLLRVDCAGQVRPALAASWRFDAEAGLWIVTLRDGAQFADGTPVTAADVLAGWSAGAGPELRPDISRLVRAAAAMDDRSLAITLRRPGVAVPLSLAHPDLAIAKPVAGLTWPLGTRAARVAADAEPSLVKGAPVITVTRESLSPLRVITAAGDQRDLLDRGVDLLLTRDPATLDYARTLPQFQLVPLAWQSTHVLLTPGRKPSTPVLSEQARQVLAADAVRGDARGAQGPFWWEDAGACEIAPSGPHSQAVPAPRIVFDAGDSVARDLSERFVGLVRHSGPGAAMFLDALLPDRPRRTYQRAAGLTGDGLTRARRLGVDAGYVVRLDSRPLDPCREAQALVDLAPWLDAGTVVPLVDTRLHAIIRRGRAGASTEWDGGMVLASGNEPKPR
jgi:hypothetical protein